MDDQDSPDVPKSEPSRTKGSTSRRGSMSRRERGGSTRRRLLGRSSSNLQPSGGEASSSNGTNTRRGKADVMAKPRALSRFASRSLLFGRGKEASRTEVDADAETQELSIRREAPQLSPAAAQVDESPDDLASLPHLNDEAVVNGVRLRYERDVIYTRINTLLIALNPYQWLPIYGPEVMSKYSNVASGTLPPHVYGTAAAAYDGLLSSKSQSIVISGESGAGKSETAKKVLQHLAWAATKSGSQNGKGIEARILASNPIMESFGNAKTSMNNNSSRYGKFLMMQFDLSGRLVGALIKTYLLEKTRVVRQGAMERNYHIFYPLAISNGVSSTLHLPDAGSLRYTGLTGCLESPGWDDLQEFSSCMKAMSEVGVEPAQQEKVWKLLAVVLLLGQIEFSEGDVAEISQGSKALLEKLCGMIEIDEGAMGRALTIKMTKMGNDWVTAPNTPAKASELRDGLARYMYSTIFDWLVVQINRSLQLDPTEERAQDDMPDQPSKAQNFIGILDIFGFETFDVNSLEQLCINFCNERLQATFNEAVFAAVQEENAAEGIQLPEADLSEVDNSAVVKLIGGRPGGLLHSINEECIVPKGSDTTLLEKLLQMHKDNPRLKLPKQRDAFTVVHFVGPVTYSVIGLLTKNKDPVGEDLVVLLQHSKVAFVHNLFNTKSSASAAKKKEARFQGVCTKFQKQLDDLLHLVGYSHMHFVRCIKPNRSKLKQFWERELVHHQLKCSGVFEAVRVIGMGYPDRLPHFQVLGQFSQLLDEADRPKRNEKGNFEGSERAAVELVLNKFGVETSSYELGYSKVFLKAGVMPRLIAMKIEFQGRKAVKIQAVARRRFAKKTYKKLVEERNRRLKEQAAAAIAAARLKQEAAEKAQRELQEGADEEAVARASQLEEEARHARRSAQTFMDQMERLHISPDTAADAVEEPEPAPKKKPEKAEGRLKLHLPLPPSNAGKGMVSFRDSADAEEGGRDPTMLKLGLLSQRAAGGGLAPLLSTRAPNRNKVKDATKEAARGKKSAKWMEMVLEYAMYLGMDREQDEEFLWIAEQALRAPVPEGWEEMMDPFGEIYFFNETTSQSTRQHPMDGYYQSLYRKLRMQRMGGLGGGKDSEEEYLKAKAQERDKASMDSNKDRKKYATQASKLKKMEQTALKDRGNISSREMDKQKKQFRSIVSKSQTPRVGSSLSGDGLLANAQTGLVTSRTQQSALELAGSLAQPKHVISSISQALEMSSPRSATWMLERFGLTPDSGEDERCLLINPAVWGAGKSSRTLNSDLSFIECVMDKEELGVGIHRYSLSLVLNDENEAYALSALKRVVNQNTIYELSICEDDDESSGDVHFTGKLSCNARGNEFVIFDDSNDFVGISKGYARRELGVVVFDSEPRGKSLHVEFILPRVLQDGHTAQFRPQRIAESMLQLYKTGKTKHLAVLRGAVHLVPGGKVQLLFRGGSQSSVVFEAYRATGERWAVRYRHPLSAFQAFNMAVAVLHNQTTAMLDTLPPLDEVPRALMPAPTASLVARTKLEHNYGAVYSIHSFGARVFCGLHTGHVQQWQCPLSSEPVVLEWRAHSSTVYAIAVVGRTLVTGSRDMLVRCWDLHSMVLLATFAAHRGAVRCLAGERMHDGRTLCFSGSSDSTIRVWDLSTPTLRPAMKQKLPDGHRGAVRALVINSDCTRLCSASREVIVWDLEKQAMMHVLPVGRWVYSLAFSAVEDGCLDMDTLFAGCDKGLILVWKREALNKTMSPYDDFTHEETKLGKIRAISVTGSILCTGWHDGMLRMYDLAEATYLKQMRPNEYHGHTAGVRAIAVDPVSQVVYTASDDRCVKVWVEAT
mmetsp:Transcript_31082/g.75545  ORF Transcript_31082/g.75545 Transcript_31082/m.75545 type:complete len:1826 (+) Transcript_31082:341-5818(+)